MKIIMERLGYQKGKGLGKEMQGSIRPIFPCGKVHKYELDFK